MLVSSWHVRVGLLTERPRVKLDCEAGADGTRAAEARVGEGWLWKLDRGLVEYWKRSGGCETARYKRKARCRMMECCRRTAILAASSFGQV